MDINGYIESQRDKMIADLKTLIRVPSVKGDALPDMPFGENVAKALSSALSMAEDLGFKTYNRENYVGIVEYGAGDETLGILTHLDVVPEGTGWSVDPYEGAVVDDAFIGRGASDNKGPTISALYALAAVKQSDALLNKKVQLLLGCDEESGWGDIEYYKQHYILPDMAFSPDGDYPVVNAEKAILHADIKKTFRTKPTDVLFLRAGNRPNIVAPFGEAVVVCPLESAVSVAEAVAAETGTTITVKKDRDNVRISVTGKGAHASLPQEGNNAITALLAVLGKLPLTGDAGKMLRALHSAYPHKDYYGLQSFVDCSDDVSGRLTQNPGLLELNGKTLLMCSDMRVPVTIDVQEVLVRLSATFLPYNVTARHTMAAHYVEEESPLVQKLLAVYSELTGQDAYCVAVGGGTYARAVEQAVSFGCKFPGTDLRMHMADERYTIDDLLLNAKLMAHAIVALCT